jgi:putative nucleotidyltransferase with HDIG domain
MVAFNCQRCRAKINLDPQSGQFEKNAVLSEKEPVIDDKKALKDKILAGIKELPPMPQVVVKTQQLIADADVDAKRIAEVIDTDQAIATKVLKVANSAYYGMSGKISSIKHAAVVLGYKTLGEITSSVGAENILGGKLPGYGYDSQDLWKHSLAVAFGSKILANTQNSTLVNEAYTAGLIHDVGKIIMDSYVLDKKEEIESFMEKEEKAFLEAENQFFGFNHAEIGFEICHKWNFPETITTAIKNHHQPSNANGNGLSHILHMADYIAILSGIGYDADDVLYTLEEGTMSALGLKHDRVGKIACTVSESVHKIST